MVNTETDKLYGIWYALLGFTKIETIFIWISIMFLYYAETNKTCKVVNPKIRFLCMVRCDNWTETHDMWRNAKPETRFSFMYFLPADYIRKLGLSIMYYSPIPLFLYRKRYFSFIVSNIERCRFVCIIELKQMKCDKMQEHKN